MFKITFKEIHASPKEYRHPMGNKFFKIIGLFSNAAAMRPLSASSFASNLSILLLKETCLL